MERERERERVGIPITCKVEVVILIYLGREGGHPHIFNIVVVYLYSTPLFSTLLHFTLLY